MGVLSEYRDSLAKTHHAKNMTAYGLFSRSNQSMDNATWLVKENTYPFRKKCWFMRVLGVAYNEAFKELICCRRSFQILIQNKDSYFMGIFPTDFTQFLFNI